MELSNQKVIFAPLGIFDLLFLLSLYPTAVPVPLFPAGPCPECSKVGVLGKVVVTSDSKAQWCSVLTKDGTFTLLFKS